MAIKLMSSRGTRDYLGSEQQIRKEIRQTLQEVFELYGFEELESSVLNNYDIMSAKYAGGSEILKEIYTLNDQGGRKLALRYDLTVPLTRIIGMNPQMILPFRRYEIGKVFRDGPIKAGRLREFTQCDVDIVGVKSLLAEADLIALITDVFERLDMDITIQINNRKLLNGILKAMKVNDEQLNDTILILDKVEKIGIKSVSQQLAELGLNTQIVSEIAELYQNKASIIGSLDLKYSNEMLRQGLDELKELQSYLTSLNIDDQVELNPFLARGLNIYTGTVFEVFLKDNPITSSVASGGRYDNIIGTFLQNGREYPAVGCSFGLDVIYQAWNSSDTPESNIDLYIIPLNKGVEAVGIAKSLRMEGIRVAIEMMGRKLNKSLDYANKNGFPYVLILGEDELESGIVKVKNMRTGIDHKMRLDELGRFFSSAKNV
jgi:histidyl-tRNA synthetase